ncbi:tRNA uridine-5-carboxymethylaminomethyl(34) synthesis GTPase MnmE [Aquincola sp. J276]|uniref:tRNA uridine-5-carboxymethylaminomethyl(34) synthesis GTPase MnmE n=1 Tax=Aquincola sp. J276 TaxID=2898432 RepID=UPI002150E997|nr:tRNA uridine-5-carboxymethylaminomethyl(34) synthesis GTPase MnmE [Aquincola sp. J276]MCR5866125.1 tRNA uridine-5-carboxymethylaminomethyl(34) synthesis GTPase MnmE [Aquincola sp. J276]
MLARQRDAIVAIATAPGRGAVGIVRASGPDLRPLIDALCGRALQPRYATYLPLRGSDGQPIDHGLAIHFPAPHSYTGEDVLELQAHGGPVVLQLLLARCLAVGEGIGLRLAEPGEFTQRAFLNDKLDLAQAEAVSDLIDASTEAAARSASRSLSGAFSTEIGTLRDRIVHLRMLVEATLDFPEEEIDFLEKADARGQLERLIASVDEVLDRAKQGALLREGIRVVLAGQPNVGKSSLLNALAGAELAIVTPIPGTTRDKVTQTIQIEGVPLHVIDTAGLREATDEVERIGISRSWSEIEQADAVIFLHDLTRLGQADYDQGDAEIAQRLSLAEPGQQSRVLHVFNKADAADATVVPGEGSLALSAATGAGLDGLRRALLERAGWHASPEGVFIARTRHVHALRRTREHLEMARAQGASSDPALDLLAEELRLAHNALGEITGAFSADDLLGEIFSRFCIGK